MSSGKPGLTGAVSLRVNVQLPPGERRFLEKLRLVGDIGIGDARFTAPQTQQGLERISANALGGEDDPGDVVSQLRGHVSVANGVATLSGVTFRVPGASAAMSGTYELITRRVDLRGMVRLDEKLSQTTTGIKSFLLKAIDPVFRRKKTPFDSSGQDHRAVRAYFDCAEFLAKPGRSLLRFSFFAGDSLQRVCRLVVEFLRQDLHQLGENPCARPILVVPFHQAPRGCARARLH